MGYQAAQKQHIAAPLPKQNTESVNADVLFGTDLSRFDKRLRVREAVAQLQQEKPTQETKTLPRTRISFVTLAYYAFAALLAGALLWNYVQVTVLTDKAYALKKEYETLQGQEVNLRAEYDKRLNLRDIETYAVEQLGMVKLERGQVEYLELSSPDSVTMVAPEDSNRLSYYLSGLVRSFNAGLEFFK